MKKTTEMVVRKLNAHIQERIIDRGDPDFSIICDEASQMIEKSGITNDRKIWVTSVKVWGAIFQTQSINGRWSEKEQYFHINYLQLLAIFFALKSFCRDFYSKHVHIFCDNTSALHILIIWEEYNLMRWIFWQVKFGNGVLIEKSGFPVVT